MSVYEQSRCCTAGAKGASRWAVDSCSSSSKKQNTQQLLLSLFRRAAECNTWISSSGGRVEVFTVIPICNNSCRWDYTKDTQKRSRVAGERSRTDGWMRRRRRRRLWLLCGYSEQAETTLWLLLFCLHCFLVCFTFLSSSVASTCRTRGEMWGKRCEEEEGIEGACLMWNETSFLLK